MLIAEWLLTEDTFKEMLWGAKVGLRNGWANKAMTAVQQIILPFLGKA